MSARAKMIHRVTVERDGAEGEDGWGGSNEPEWATHLDDLSCRAWFDADREIIDGDKTTVIETRRVIVPLGTDVTPRDRIVSVTDRKGTEIFSGPAGIESVGRRADHIVLILGEVA